jgi:hypothetical protein
MGRTVVVMSLQWPVRVWWLEKYQPAEVAQARMRVLHAHAILVAHLCCFLPSGTRHMVIAAVRFFFLWFVFTLCERKTNHRVLASAVLPFVLRLA